MKTDYHRLIEFLEDTHFEVLDLAQLYELRELVRFAILEKICSGECKGLARYNSGECDD